MALMDPVSGEQQGCEMTDGEKRERLLQTYNAICDGNFKGVPEVSSEEVLEILSHSDEQVRASIVLVDCRSEAEQSVSDQVLCCCVETDWFLLTLNRSRRAKIHSIDDLGGH